MAAHSGRETEGSNVISGWVSPIWRIEIVIPSKLIVEGALNVGLAGRSREHRHGPRGLVEMLQKRLLELLRCRGARPLPRGLLRRLRHSRRRPIELQHRGRFAARLARRLHALMSTRQKRQRGQYQGGLYRRPAQGRLGLCRHLVLLVHGFILGGYPLVTCIRSQARERTLSLLLHARIVFRLRDLFTPASILYYRSHRQCPCHRRPGGGIRTALPLPWRPTTRSSQ